MMLSERLLSVLAKGPQLFEANLKTRLLVPSSLFGSR
jgi:hypothetical protein